MPDNQDITLKIRVLDAKGQFRGGTVDIEIKHRTLSDRAQHRGLDASREINLTGLRRAPKGDYQITVTPTDLFKPQSQFINIPASGFATMTVTIDREPIPDPEKKPDEKKPDEQKPFVVRGTVRDGNQKPARVTVKAFDRDLRSEELLGEAAADAKGGYEIRYSPEQFLRAEKGNADLRVGAYDDHHRELVSSPIIFNAQPEETVDLVIGLEEERSEYERYLIKLTPVLDRIRIADLTEEDIVFLTGETSINQQHLMFLVTAARFSEKTKANLASEVFYGLVRENLPTELPDLLAQSTEILRGALRSALRDNLVPARLGIELEELLARLKALRLQFALQLPGEEGKTPLGALLDLGLPSPDKQITFLTLYTDHQGEIEEFWLKLRDHPKFKDGGQVEQLQFTFQLGALTGNNVKLVKALRQDGSIKSTLDLTKLNLDAWTNVVKTTAGDNAGNIPTYIEGATPEEKVSHFAHYIVETLKSAFPSKYVQIGITQQPEIDPGLLKRVLELNPDLDPSQPPADTMNWGDIADADRTKASEALVGLRNEIRMFPQFDYQAALSSSDGNGNIGSLQNPVRQGVATFLANASDFDFGKTHVDSWLDENSARAFRGVDASQKTAVINQLKALQRVYQVVPRYEAMAGLMSAGLDSAQAIASIPADVFAQLFGAQMGSEFDARVIQESAIAMRDQTLVVYGNAAEVAGGVFPWVIGAPSPSIRNDAAYADLFGRFDLCDCEHCRSVYSPAAYFVDLLEFLNPKTGFWFRENKPVDILLGRRPDLKHLPLTCENTNTKIPYIDLVNEVLETYVALRSTLDRTITDDISPVTSAELMANPQHVNTTAYERELKRAVYPSPLPFNRDLEVVRAYLGHLGSSRYEVMKTFQRTVTAPGAEVARECEYLKISPEERAVLTSIDARELYGYGSARTDDNWQDSLAAVDEFLKRTNLKYRDLEELLQTRFINPASDLRAPGAVVIFALNERCDPRERRLRHRDESPLSFEDWKRLQRLVRLWRKLGWPMLDVDRALLAFRVTTASQVNDDLLIKLGQSVRLQHDLDLPLSDTLSFWSNIDTRGDDVTTRRENSLYARLFWNRTVRALASGADPTRINDPFELDHSGSELRTRDQHISDHAPAILAALQLRADELATLRNATRLEDQAAIPATEDHPAIPASFAPLNLENLSLLYRYVVLARALHLSIKDLIALRQLTGMDPFSEVIAPDGTRAFEPSLTLQFVEKVKKVRQSGFSIAQLNYLYRHVADPVGDIAPPHEEIASLLATIRTGLKKIAADTAAPDVLAHLSASLVVQTLSDAFTLDVATTEILLTTILKSRANPGRPIIQDFLALRDGALPQSLLFTPHALDGYTLLHKAASMINTFEMTTKEVAYLSEHGGDFEGVDPALRSIRMPFDLNRLPLELPDSWGLNGARFSQWERLYDLFELRNALPTGEVNLIDVFATAEATTTETTVRERTLAKLQSATGWEIQLLKELTGADGFNLRDLHLKNEIELRRIAACLQLGRQLGAAANHLFAWAEGVPDANQAQQVKNAAKAKYEDAEWLKVAKGLNDGLREKQRTALIARILTSPAIIAAGVHDSNQLFEYFLIDVEMSACMATSRIKQAISSVQLFVQRCFMNLEPAVAPNTLSAKHWKWMKSYRIWEANRKVFLYPENWIEPELRDDKSPLFKDLENELLQNEVTQDTAETAFLNYLEKLDEVARLDIRGMYWEHESETIWEHPEWTSRQQDPDEPADSLPGPEERADILYVFGRTQATPPIYYYRKLLNHRTWSPWEKVQVDIEGDHLIPVVYNRRLFLFWPTFTETQEGPPASTTPGLDIRRIANETRKRLEIQLAWSECKNGKWSAKKVSPERISTDYLEAQYRSDFFFNAQVENDELVITCKRWADTWELTVGSSVSKMFVRPGTDLPVDLRIVLNLFDVVVVTRPRIRNRGGFAEIGTFTFSGCEGRTVPASISAELDFSGWPLLPYLSHVEGELFRANENVETLTLRNPSGAGLRVLPANRHPQPDLRITDSFRILFPHQYPRYWLQSPFFYQDMDRTYFVTPEQVANVVIQLVDPSQARPSSRNVSNDLGLSLVTIGASPKQQAAATINSNSAGKLNPTVDLIWNQMAACPGDQSFADLRADAGPTDRETSLKLRFNAFYHSHICTFIKALKRTGITGLLNLENQNLSDFTANGTVSGSNRLTVFRGAYDPGSIVDVNYPKEDVDFARGAYSLYNWELFFHAPLLIAMRLSKNQRFDEARQWFHYIFDPTDDSDDPVPQRFWKVLPFYLNDHVAQDQIGELLRLLSYRGNDSVTLGRKRNVEDQVREWQDDPFNPHKIARMRITAYQKTVVMKYIDNLVAWGDQLFRQDTIESINEATQLYVLAHLMLGPRPEIIPPREKVAPRTYATLRPDLDRFSNALVSAENAVAPRRCSPLFPRYNSGSPSGASLGTTFYFCIPPNDKLLGYWNLVADRLFKIRHCMNIEGTVRELPLFEPPIDPALLVRARAAGLDLSTILADTNAALPAYRFNIMVQKALELCAEVKSLGAALLSALEKRDAEELTRLRSGHEISLLEAVRVLKEKQIEEARDTWEGLQKSKEVVTLRRDYYQRLLSTPLGLNAGEALQLFLATQSLALQQAQAHMDMLANILHLIPNIKLGVPVTMGATFGGHNLGEALRAFSTFMGAQASIMNSTGAMSATVAGHERRADEWRHQKRMSDKELEQIEKQIAAADIRRQIAEKDLDNHDKQIENAKAVDEYMRSKFTNRELYNWMVSQVSALYFQTYQLAYDLAKRAEKAYQFERGLTSSNFIQFGYWDSLKKGLLAGERLHLDLKRLDIAYLDQNKREFEITKNISLLMTDPLALIKLREKGDCEFRLPEELFDLDYPGHYMRRIKSVSLTIPCVTGPYTNINCTLTLLSNKTRIENKPSSPYAERDDRFVTNFAAMQSVTTSHAQNDSGLFELNFRDERYLPFEGAGAISQWRIEMPKECNRFDFNTISDVVLHLKYTARDGGETLKTEAMDAVVEQTRAHPRTGTRLFSARHEFANDWFRFLHAPETASGQTLSLDLKPEHFPFNFKGQIITINQVVLCLNLTDGRNPASSEGRTYAQEYVRAAALRISLTPGGAESAGELTSNPEFLGGLPHIGLPVTIRVPAIPTASPTPVRLVVTASDADIGRIDQGLRHSVGGRHRLNAEAIDDIFIVCHYSVD